MRVDWHIVFVVVFALVGINPALEPLSATELVMSKKAPNAPPLVGGGSSAVVGAGGGAGAGGGSARASRFDWPSLKQEQVIALGESAVLKRLPTKFVKLYCSNARCEALRRDFDDAFQIANWKGDFEDRFVDSEADDGIFIGPPGKDADALVKVIAETTGLKATVVGIDDIKGLGIIFGKKPQ